MEADAAIVKADQKMGGKMAIGYDAIGLRIKFARIRATVSLLP